MKRLGIIQFGVIVIVGIALLSGYSLARQGMTSRLNGELSEIHEKISRQQLVDVQIREQRLRLSGATDLASFVESLYACAQLVGVTDHEVTTSRRREHSQVRRSRKSQRQDAGEILKVNRLQVVLHGDYRSLAEYLRKVGEIDRLKQVVRCDITPDKGSLKMLLLLDLYSLKGLDES